MLPNLPTNFTNKITENLWVNKYNGSCFSSRVYFVCLSNNGCFVNHLLMVMVSVRIHIHKPLRDHPPENFLNLETFLFFREKVINEWDNVSSTKLFSYEIIIYCLILMISVILKQFSTKALILSHCYSSRIYFDILN